MAEAIQLIHVAAGASSADTAPMIRIEMDERCFLFPDGKLMTHVLLCREGSDTIGFDAVFPFNATRISSRFLTLSRAEARLFVKELIEVVYAAKSGFLLHGGLKISIVVAANGYRVDYHRADMRIETFLSTAVIWRFIKGILMAVDEASPVVSH
jgi:hypothetical protein